jgi:hypothetical protein
MPRPIAVFALSVFAGALWAAQPQFWRIEGAQELLEGSLDRLSVDDKGRLQLAPAQSLLYDTEAPDVWCLVRDPKGAVYLGTGNEGRVLRFENGAGRQFFKAPELEVHTLALGPDGTLYAGTAPDGKVYAIDKTGAGKPFFEPKDRYIWALAIDSGGNLLVATGSEGKVYKVGRDGKAQVLFLSHQTNITSLATDAKGNVYAGSGGVVFRIDPKGTVSALYDSPYREIAALDVAEDGTVYAAAEDGGENEEIPIPRPVFPLQNPTAASQPGTAEVIVTETVTAIPVMPASPTPQRPQPPRRPGAKGAILALSPGGALETKWTSMEEMPHSLIATKDGVVFGTGNKGKLYRVRPDESWTMLTSFPSQQVTALARGEKGDLLVATSNAGRLYSLGPGNEAKGTYTSKVKDAEVVSSWGRVRYASRGGRVEISTRSGNTQSPDSTWSDWSKPYARSGDPVPGEPARFLQMRVTLRQEGPDPPVLDSVETGYLQKNLRPRLEPIEVHPPGEVIQRPLSLSGEADIWGADPTETAEVRPGAPKKEAGVPVAFARKMYQKGWQTLSWKAEDPNGDPLVYTAEYRNQSDDHYHLLRKGFTDPVIAWDTATVPSGRYVVRVTASDSPGNPEGLALTTQRESAPFDVDNTPPAVVLTLVSRSPLKVHAVVTDDHSVVRKAEYSLDGGRWQEVYPTSGINDGLEESYDITLPEPKETGPHSLVVRGTDAFGNAATSRVDLKGP